MNMSSKSTFEEKLKELSDIAEKLESNNISLDESILLYEKGMKLSKECADELNSAKQKIVSLTEAENGDIND